jgi:Na+-transporting NADH:ubiquinone oxidoreductase subunit NqrD
MNAISEPIKAFLDWCACGAGVGVAIGLLPHLAGLFSIVWLGLQIYDRIRYGYKRIDRLDS